MDGVYSKSAVSRPQLEDSAFRIPSPRELAQRLQVTSADFDDDLNGMDDESFVDLAVAGRGHLSNTPPSNRQPHPCKSSSDNSPLPRLAIAGIDWLEWCAYGSWDRRRFDELCERLDQAKEAAQAAGGETVIDIDGEPVAVKSAGLRRGLYCKYGLTWQGIEIGIVNRVDECEHSHNIHVVAGSMACMQAGVGVYSRVCRFLERLGFGQSKTVLSRIDLAADLVGVTVKLFTDAFVTESVIRRAKDWEFFGKGRYRNTTGFSIGKSAVKLRVYDKLLEGSKSGDIQKFAVLVEKRWNGDAKPAGGATRVEFQFKRDVLRAMGLSEVPVVLGRLGELARWATEDWCRFTDGVSNRNHCERVPSSALWQTVQAAFAESFRGGDEKPIVWRKPLRALPEKLLQQAGGCLSSALAVLGSIPEAVEDAAAAVVASLAEHLQGNVDAVRIKRAILETRAAVPVLVGGVGSVQGPYDDFAAFSGNTQ